LWFLLTCITIRSMEPQETSITFYVKKPECPTRKRGDEWPNGFFF
jgi:hypothetical protein